MYDLYGFTHDDLDAARAAVEGVLPMPLESRNSLYYGGDYYLWHNDDHSAVIILQTNQNLMYQEELDPEEAQWVEADYRMLPLLLTIEHADKDDFKQRLLAQLENIVYLERRL